MSTAFLDITAALDTRLNAMSGLPPVAWENLKYEPIKDTLYLLPSNIQNKTLPVTEEDQTTGIYQIDIIAPVGVGKNESIAMADTIANQFKQNTEFTYNGVTVRIEKFSMLLSEVIEQGWYRIRTKIDYHSFTARR